MENGKCFKGELLLMVNLQKLSNYSSKASWAVWNEDSLSAKEVANSHLKSNCTWQLENAISIIQKSQNTLRTDVVILGINASNQCKNWSNYHFGGKSADKNLMFAFDKSPYRGCYMTDFSQIIHKKAAIVYNELIKDKTQLHIYMSSLMVEFNNVGIPPNALFLLLGTNAAKLYHVTLQEKYPNHVELQHCSVHGITAHDWVECTWCKISKYTAENKYVPPFEIYGEMNIVLSNLKRSNKSVHTKPN
jgi:hypothetical protein